MGVLKKYGQYWIFAAMVVSGTGTFIWNSSRRDIRGEDFAELYNAAVERFVIPQLTGADLPAWPSAVNGTNLFSTVGLSKTDRTALLDATVRAVFGRTNYNNGEGKIILPNGAVPCWLLSTNTLYSGSADFISSPESVVIRDEDEDYYDAELDCDFLAYRLSQSNRVDGALTAESYSLGGTYMPSIFSTPPTNAPLWAAIYGDTNKPTLSFSFALPSSGSFWTTNYGTVAYRFHAQTNPTNSVLLRRDLVDPATVLAQLTTTVKRIDASPICSTHYYIYIDGELYMDGVHTDQEAIWSSSAYTNWEEGEYVSWLPPASELVPPPELSRWNESITNFSYVTVESFNSGQTINYPSLYAITNGYVQRIRVFGVFRSSVASTLTAVPVQNPTEAPVSDYLDMGTAYPITLSDMGITFSGYVSTFNPGEYTGTSLWPYLVQPLFLYEEVSPSVYYVKLQSPKITLLYEIENPTERQIEWADLTIPYITAPSIIQPTSWYQLTGYPFTNNVYGLNRIQDSYEAWNVSAAQVFFDSAFVVVDWNWKHLRPPE